MQSILDLLINEVANVLGITPAEVKARFTKEELNELLNNSLCEPTDEIGIPITSLETPCDDLAVPNLLPPLDVNNVVDVAAAEKVAKKNDPTKCVDAVSQVCTEIESELSLYNDHKILLEKLLEYRDNYTPVAFYFEERSKEAARLLNIFQPILSEIKKIESANISIDTQITNLKAQLQKENNSLSKNTSLIQSLNNEIQELEDNKSTNNLLINEQNQLLKKATDGISIFSDPEYNDVINSINGPADYLEDQLRQLYTKTFSSSTLSTINSQVSKYSGFISLESGVTPANIQQATENAYLSFKLEFLNLTSVKKQEEKVDKTTGARKNITTDFPIRNSQLLEKNTFFQDNSVFTVKDSTLSSGADPIGTIYTSFYNLLKDPTNNFFTPEERGLTSSSANVDPKLKGTSAQIKKEKGVDYYIQDLSVTQNFYQNFEKFFEVRKEERRTQTITAAQSTIRTVMESVAQKEVQVILAISRVNKYLPEDDVILNSALTSFKNQNDFFVQAKIDLDTEIERIQQKLIELKPDPDKVKAKLRKASPECFDKIDDPTEACNSVKSKLGSDPLFTKTINGTDPTLPSQNQFCYWLEFTKIINIVGLLPLPNVPNATQLRYWPVGLIIPYPGGLIKIPLPIIWVPLVVFSTPMGNIVIYLTINGVFISPVVFFVSSTGFKQHIVTIRGSSEKFGYSADDESIKPGIQIPAFVLAAKDRINRLAKEASLGVDYNLTNLQKQQKAAQASSLAAAEANAAANNNSVRSKKVKKAKENFNKAVDNKGENEKLAAIADAVDSVKDAIADAKRAVYNRLEELGKPPIGAANLIKNKIAERRTKLQEELKQALIDGDTAKAARIRAELKSDGVELSDKINAITQDASNYFNKIQFPKIIIPKDTSTIDPKQNVLLEFINTISEFSSIHKTQFYSPDDAKVVKLVLRQLAKSKEKIKEEITPEFNADGKLDVEKDTSKIKKALKKINKTLIDALSGKGTFPSPESIQKEIDDLKTQVEKEKDSVKKKKAQTKLQKKQKLLSDSLENERVKTALSLTPEVMAALGQISIDFNPFASCCNTKSFSLNLGVSPALPIFASVLSLLNTSVDSLSPAQLKSLFGAKSQISLREMVSSHVDLIKRSIPNELVIPLPNINLLTFTKSFTGLFTSLFEIKAPNVYAQPALPTSIPIDLNILKGPLKKLFLEFLSNSLPNPNNTFTPKSGVTQVISTSSTPSNNSILNSSNDNAVNNKAILDSKIKTIGCDTTTAEDSALSNGTYSPKNKNGGLYVPTSTSSQFSTSTVIVESNRDVLPAFQNLDLDFLNVNPGDILVIIKNFVDLVFNDVEKLLDPFYTLLNIAKGLKGTNLNLLESIQYKIPPYGPAAEAAFIALTKAKQLAPRSATLKLIDTEAAAAAIKKMEPALTPLANSGLPYLLSATAGAADSILPKIKVPQVDPDTKVITTKDSKVASLALRSINPVLSQDDLPPWERLSSKNILFLLFADDFVATGADQVGFFRSFI